VTSRSPAHPVVERYYELFNAHRFADAAALISDDCDFSHTATRQHAHGRRGFQALVDDWLQAVPDLSLTPESVSDLEPGLVSVRVCLRGHFRGDFAIGGHVVSGSGQAFVIRGIHRIRVRDDLIVHSEFTFDPADLLRVASAAK
jgi:steroid delta-isomerase-like uncharacterized protein